MTKSGREIVEIFGAFDLTGTAWSAAQLAGCDSKTVARYVALRDAGGDPLAAIAGRFADGDLASIIDHLAAEREIGEVVIADEAHSAQPGTAGWARLGGQEAGR